MTWFKVDDGADSHPKVLAAGNEAFGLWTRLGAYCSRNLTDGFVPEQLGLMYGSHELLERLVEVRLLSRVTGGWQMHDYLSYNPSRIQVEAERAATAERQRRFKARKLAEKTAGQSFPHANNGVSNGVSGNGTSNGVSNGVANAAPTRPDPLSTKNKDTPPLRGAPRAANAPRPTRIPTDFAPTPEMIAWARQETPGVVIQRTTEDFCDYWASKPGKDAEKLDWNRTWKRWMRKASQDLPRRPGGTNGHQMATTDRKIHEIQAMKKNYEPSPLWQLPEGSAS